MLSACKKLELNYIYRFMHNYRPFNIDLIHFVFK